MRRRLPLLLSVFGLLLVAVIAARGQSGVPHGRGLIPRPRPPTPTTAPPQLAPSGVVHSPITVGGVALVTLLVAGALILGIAGVIWLVSSLRWSRGRRAKTRLETQAPSNDAATGPPAAQTILHGAQQALAQLRQSANAPPADLVQRAWLTLEEAAARCGARRRPEQTATEFTTALLATFAVSDTALATLRGAYQRARFGDPGALTTADVEAAGAAVEVIVRDLAAATTRPGVPA